MSRTGQILGTGSSQDLKFSWQHLQYFSSYITFSRWPSKTSNTIVPFFPSLSLSNCDFLPSYLQPSSLSFTLQLFPHLIFHSRIPLSPSFPSPIFPFHPTCSFHSHTSAHILATEHWFSLNLKATGCYLYV